MGRDDAFGSLPASAQVMLLRICSPSALSCVMLLDMVRLLLTRGYTLCGASLLISLRIAERIADTENRINKLRDRADRLRAEGSDAEFKSTISWT